MTGINSIKVSGGDYLSCMDLFPGRVLGGRSVFSVFRTDITVLFFMFLSQQWKYLGPPIVLGLGVVFRNSPLLLPSYPFLENWARNTVPFTVLLSVELSLLLVVLINNFVGGGLMLCPIFVTSMCLRSLR